MTNRININIWNRNFTLTVEYDCYSGEQITKSQEDALNCFIKNEELINKSNEIVKKYCKKNVNEDYSNQKKDNIFSYLMPDYIFVKREDNPRVALMCKYKYDLEHGLAIIFDMNGKITVGLQDIIL